MFVCFVYILYMFIIQTISVYATPTNVFAKIYIFRLYMTSTCQIKNNNRSFEWNMYIVHMRVHINIFFSYFHVRAQVSVRLKQQCLFVVVVVAIWCKRHSSMCVFFIDFWFVFCFYTLFFKQRAASMTTF